jgi:hypothetical protein
LRRLQARPRRALARWQRLRKARAAARAAAARRWQAATAALPASAVAAPAGTRRPAVAAAPAAAARLCAAPAGWMQQAHMTMAVRQRPQSTRAAQAVTQPLAAALAGWCQCSTRLQPALAAAGCVWRLLLPCSQQQAKAQLALGSLLERGWRRHLAVAVLQARQMQCPVLGTCPARPLSHPRTAPQAPRHHAWLAAALLGCRAGWPTLWHPEAPAAAVRPALRHPTPWVQQMVSSGHDAAATAAMLAP